MLQSYGDLCAIEIKDAPLRTFDQAQAVTVTANTLILTKTCYATFESGRFIQQRGNFNVGNTCIIGNKTFSNYKGVGEIQLAATKNNLNIVEIDNSYVVVNKRYFAGFIGNLSIRKIQTVSSSISLEKSILSNFAASQTLQVSQSIDSKLISDNFIVIGGSGIVIIEVPFSNIFLQETKQQRNSDVSVVKMENLVYLTPPLSFSVFKDTCMIKGQCTFITEIISWSLAKEFQLK